MNIEVINFRKWEKSGTLGFFDVALDRTFIIRGFALKQKKDGKGYYYQAPSKPRQTKVKATVNGESVDAYVPVMDEKNFPKYDAAFDLFGEGTGSDYKPLGVAYDGRDEIIQQALQAFGVIQTGPSRAGVGARAAAATRPAQITTAVDGASDDDDGLPF